MINFILWIILGALVGWIASKVMGTDAEQGSFLNIVVGIVGAFLSGLILSPLFHRGTINQGDFSLGGLLMSLLGAMILLGIVNYFRVGRVRRGH